MNLALFNNSQTIGSFFLALNSEAVRVAREVLHSSEKIGSFSKLLGLMHGGLVTLSVSIFRSVDLLASRCHDF